jgi:hypothetical protein
VRAIIDDVTGDVVTKGTVLIEGWLEGQYTGIRYVHANGEVQEKYGILKKLKNH